METRLWELYNLIKENSLRGTRTTQKQICDNIPDYTYKERKGTTDKCSKIWQDIDLINQSDEIEKVILTEKYEYWIGTEKETNEYIAQYFNTIAPALKRYWNMVKKTQHNGQYKIFSCQGNIIDENSKAREYVDSFVKPKYKSEDELNAMTDKELEQYLYELSDMHFDGLNRVNLIREINVRIKYLIKKGE